MASENEKMAADMSGAVMRGLAKFVGLLILIGGAVMVICIYGMRDS